MGRFDMFGGEEEPGIARTAQIRVGHDVQSGKCCGRPANDSDCQD